MKVFGTADADARAQLERCQAVEPGAPAVLCADHHIGYSMPIGGVVAYRDFVSPSAVGFDIACGNMAVRTDARAGEIDVRRVMDDIWRTIAFGIGRKNRERVEHDVLDEIAGCDHRFQRSLAKMAAEQLGTVGSGNHYVDLFEDAADGALWVGVHFGSRGFGHRTATWALERAGAAGGGMHAPPVVIPLHSGLGGDYLDGMERAGRYAYAGREWVIARVLKILGARAIDTIHNHHNFAWRETHRGRTYWVHRKGATPAFPGQRGFVGATMRDRAVIVEGVESDASADALYSTVHGAGRVMSRTVAAGKFQGFGRKRRLVRPGKVDFEECQRDVAAHGVELRGGGADEAPACYKSLADVLAFHGRTVRVLHELRPIGVAMAGSEEFDPYKD